jgi:serine/threonine protein kinase/tetratricopeptide (TPR) repeat protein
VGSKKANVKAIFCAAIEKESSAQRSAYLDEACRGDKQLRADVEALLKAHYEGKSLLDKPVLGPDVTLGDSPLTEGPGTRIGRYKLLQLIGEGGFGVVYMAEQQKPIRRRVALKIIKLGMDTKQVIARFEAERQALAMMEHPNIAKVLDAGATETGRPYFVMELVKGIPITEYCDKNNLDTRQRLELFIEVCKAIQHAHQKGIIHRDIKPTNVMITLHDGKPVPKIIDFGIAKATQQRLTEKTLFTEYKRFIGTPAYMSPEQAEISGLDVDTRSDIYSLGVLLYELLTGGTPLEAEKLRSAAYDEMCRMIRETEPPKPSTRLSTLGDALADIAKHRDIQPAGLRKLIRGDLDWIVMKTLEKDRTRRYETANELAMDIGRHLRDEPITAGPPSTVYQLRKFVRRHRTGVMFGLLVAAALLIGLCLATVGFIQANREKERTQAALAQAEANFKLAREAVDELTRAADQQLSGAPAGHQVGRRLLEKAQVFHGRFLEKRRDEPAAREQAGQAYRHLAKIHEALGEYKEAEQAYRRAIDVFEKLAEDFPEIARHQVCIVHAMDNLDDSLEALGRHKEAAETRTALRDMATGLVRRFPHDTLCRRVLVEEFRRQGSRQYYEDAIALFEDLLADHPSCRYELATLLIYFGTFLKGDGRLEEAREAKQKAETIRQELVALLPRLPSETRRLHLGLSGQADYKVRIKQVGKYQLYVRSARHDGASNSFYAWIEELADGPGGTIADWYMCITRGRGADFAKSWKGTAHFERVVLEVRDRGPAVWQIAAPGDYTITFAPRKDGVAIDAFMFQLASLPAPQGDGPEESPMTKEKVFLSSDGRVVVEAEHFADRTPLECSWLVVPGEDGGDTAHINFRGTGYVQALPDMSPSPRQWEILTYKGDTQSDLKQWERAVADYSEAISMKPDYFPAWTGRGRAYLGLGRWDEAIADFSKAIELDPNHFDPWHGCADAYMNMEQWDKALADYSKAIELSPDGRSAWEAWEERFAVHLELGQADKGLAEISEAISLSPDDPWLYGHRASAYEMLGQWDKVLANISKAISLEPDNAHWWCWRAEIYSNMKRWDEAIADYSKAVELSPYYWWPLDGFAWLLATGPNHLRNPARAVELATRAVQRVPGDGSMWGTLGVAYYRTGRWEEALEALLKSVELTPVEDATATILFLAMAHHQLGQAEEARQQYEQAADWMEQNQTDDDNLFSAFAEATELLGVKEETAANEEEVVPEKTEGRGQRTEDK